MAQPIGAAAAEEEEAAEKGGKGETAGEVRSRADEQSKVRPG